MKLTVRVAEPGDVAAISDLEALAFPTDAWSPGMVAEGVGGLWPTTRFRVAEYQGAVVGYVAASVVDDLVELQRIVVRPGDRRFGVGSALFSDVLALADAEHARRVLLEVREDNAAGRGFYDAQGFVEIAQRPRYYRDGVTALVLERPLGTDRMDADD